MLRKASIADPTYEPFHKSVVDTLRDAEVVEGKNLLPLTLKKMQSANTSSGTWSGNIFVRNGITYTINTDNNGNVVNIVANGTASGYTELNLVPNNTFYLPKGSYILSGGVTNDARIFYYNGTSYYDSKPDEVNFDVSGNESNTRYVITVVSGTTVNNAVFKPMIRKATETDPTYEPYYIPLKESKFDRAEQAVLGAKNLNAVPYTDSTKTDRGVTFTLNSDGSVTVNGTNDGTGNSLFYAHPRYNFKSDLNPLILPNGKYIVSGCPNGGSTNTYYIICTYTINGSGETYGSDYGDGVEITLQGDDRSQSEVQLGLYITVKSGQTVNNLVFKPMLRLASDPDNSYVPYAMTNKELTEIATVKTGTITDIADVTKYAQWSFINQIGKLAKFQYRFTVGANDISTADAVIADFGINSSRNDTIFQFVNRSDGTDQKLLSVNVEGKLVLVSGFTLEAGKTYVGNGVYVVK